MNGPTLAARLKDLEENPTQLSFYAKSNCKHCNGRGRITRSVPAGYGTWEEKTDFCGCVLKALKQEMKANG